MSDYAKGFKDGFAAGLEEGKKIVEEQWRQEKINEIEKSIPKPLRLDDYVFGSKDNCPKCGITLSGVMGYVCSSINCPTFLQTVSKVGAVGGGDTAMWPMGANGGTDGSAGLANGYSYR